MTELSFDPLIGLVDFVANYTSAIETGNTKFLAFLPIFFQQTVSVLAQQRLNHTRPNFLASVNIDAKDELLIVSVNPDDWLGVHVEAGADSWPMVKTHLRGPKTRTTKDGKHRYKIIPMRMWKSSPSAQTEKGMAFYEQIAKALTKPRYGRSYQKMNPDGSISVRQELITTIPEAQGMYRVMQYASPPSFMKGDRPTHSQHVLFRTMSDRYPEKFVHPGIKPANILKDAHKIVEDGLDEKWKSFVQTEMTKKGIA